MMPPLLTIVTIVRHDQPGLDLTVESVSAECPFAEHLIVDGSDKPLAIRNSRANVRVIVGRDTGISHAFNKGVLNATGEYILFINAGDTLVEGAGEAILRALQDTSVGCHFFQVYRVRDGVRSVYLARPKWLTCSMSIPHQGMIMRRILFAETGLFPLQRYSMDHYLALSLHVRRARFKVLVHDVVIAEYPLGGHSTQGGHKPFLANVWNTVRIAPRYALLSAAANTYLYLKTAALEMRSRSN